MVVAPHDGKPAAMSGQPFLPTDACSIGAATGKDDRDGGRPHLDE